MATSKKKKGRRVPDAKPKHNNYLNTSAKHLGTGTPRRGEELGLTAGETDDWIQYKDDWNPVWDKYIDPSQRTSAITLEINNRMKSFFTFSGPLLTRMSASTLLTETDREKLNLFEHDKTRTAKGKITDSAYVNISAMGGGFMKFRVRIAEDASRASMHPEADFIEVKWLVLNDNPSVPGPVPTPPAQIPTVDQANNYAISKKALFVLELGNNLAGKYILAFVRWANASNPANNGPWSLPIIGLIQ
jgi:hypothetical protein